MNYNSTIKKFLVGLVMLVAVVAVITLIVSIFMKPKTEKVVDQKPQEQPKSAFEKTEVDPTKAPEKFPQGVPIETGAKITQNYNASAPDGRFQATRAFETNKTLDQNLAIYQDYFKKNGWDIKSTVNQENYRMIFGTKGNGNLQVSINDNVSLKIKTVTISYTEVPVN